MSAHGIPSELHDERFEFTLLRVDIGLPDDFTVHPPGASPFSGGSSSIRDSISFNVGGHAWKLRGLVSYGGECLPADTALYRAWQQGTLYQGDLNLKHAILELPTKGISQADAEEMADNIGWLLGLALGQRVTWNQVGIRKNHVRRLVRSRAVSLPEEASVKQPVTNEGEQQLRGFLQTAYPIFMLDTEWWKVTSHWFSLACEISTVEVSGMIHSMLLDRISSQVLTGYSFGKLIGDDLDSGLADPRRCEALAQGITVVFKDTAAGWTSDHSKRLIQKVREWNNNPSYPKKIATVYERVGLQPPPKMVIDARHTLMHLGSLPNAVKKEILAYHRDIHQSIVVLLLAMLGYNGNVFVPDRGSCPMADFKAT